MTSPSITCGATQNGAIVIRALGHRFQRELHSHIQRIHHLPSPRELTTQKPSPLERAAALAARDECVAMNCSVVSVVGGGCRKAVTRTPQKRMKEIVGVASGRRAIIAAARTRASDHDPSTYCDAAAGAAKKISADLQEGVKGSSDREFRHGGRSPGASQIKSSRTSLATTRCEERLQRSLPEGLLFG